MSCLAKEEAETVSSRIPKNLRNAMRKMIIMDTHLNESDWIRAAIREKIKRDAPHLIKEMLEEEE